MPAYQSPKGVLYNLDKFVLYEVSTNTIQGPGINKSTSKLEAETENGKRSVIHAGTEEECKRELERIQTLLTLPLPVVVTGTINRS